MVRCKVLYYEEICLKSNFTSKTWMF